MKWYVVKLLMHRDKTPIHGQACIVLLYNLYFFQVIQQYTDSLGLFCSWVNMGLHVQPSFALLLSSSSLLPKHGCHLKHLLIKAYFGMILLLTCEEVLHARAMHLLSKFELKIPPSHPQTTFY